MDMKSCPLIEATASLTEVERDRCAMVIRGRLARLHLDKKGAATAEDLERNENMVKQKYK